MASRDRPQPEVSFILPSYNREQVLRRCLERLAAAPHDFPHEVIVMDNASEDGSASMVRSEFPGVRLTALDRNLGAASRNLALAQARGRYIVMLDDDSYPVGGAVSTALEVFRSDRAGTIGCIAFNIRRTDGSHETAGLHTVFTGCGAMFRREAFDRAGGYPDDYLWYVEEYDVACRILAAGMDILNFRELEVVHLKSSVRRDFDRIMTQLVRNNILLWTKYLPADLAAAQLETEIWRYRKIAMKEGAVDGFERGTAAGREAAARWLSDRSLEMGRDAAARVLGTESIRRAVGRARAAAPRGKVLVFNVGKALHLVLDELRAADLEVTGLVDDNRFMQGDGFRGVPISSRGRLAEGGFDAVLIGSSALSLNDAFEGEIRRISPGIPVVRLCEYDRLEDHLAPEARPAERKDELVTA